MSATAWKHQLEAVSYARGRRDVILHCGMGTGKSRMAIEILLECLAANPKLRVILGCPKAVMPAWAKQFRSWAPKLRIVVLDKGTCKAKEAQIKAALASDEPVVIVGNYESLYRIKSLEKTRLDALVWDECHRLKSPSGAQSKWASRVAAANPTAKRIALSGTLLSHALSSDCPVLTPTGWVPISSLQIGDEVVGAGGAPTKVVGVWPQGVKQLFRVSFSDGASIECTADHLWSVTSRGRDSRGIGAIVIPTGDLDRRVSRGHKGDGQHERCGVLDSCSAPRWAIPIMQPAQFASREALPIDPYVLGVLLGDGHLGHPVDITTPDKEIVDEVARRLPSGYLPHLARHTERGVAKRYRITSGNRGGSEKGSVRGPKKNPISVALDEMGLRGKTGHIKFIPDKYLFSSHENRLLLLRGLCDTDGTSCATSTVYTTTSPQLAEGVRFLARSLGGYVAMSERPPRLVRLPQGTYCTSKTLYALTIRMPECPFMLARKRKKWSPWRRRPRRGIVSVEPTGQREATCITVAAEDGLYVARDFIVTHNSPLDAFGVYRAVESPECPTFGKWYTPFKGLFAIENPHIRGMVIGYRNQELFAKKVAETTFFRRSEDVLDLPPLMFEDIAVPLTAAEAKTYREVEHDFVSVLDAGTITVQNAMHSVLRLQQICGGFAKLDETESGVVHQIDESPSKRAALLEWLEDLDAAEPVVVFCRFHSDIDSALWAAKQAGRAASELSGRTKLQGLADWQAGRTNVLVAQIQSGGIGIDLTRASYGCFYSLGYSLSEYLQAVARLHRPGQTKTTRFYHLIGTVARGGATVDARIYAAISERKEVIDEILIGYKRAGRVSATGRSA